MVNLTPNPSYSITITVSYPNRVGMLASVTTAIAGSGGNLGKISLSEQTRKTSRRQIVVEASSGEHAEEIVAAVKALPEVTVLDVWDRTFELHKGGKIRIHSRLPLQEQSDLAMAYTPGVGRVCKAIAEEPEKVFSYTIKSNTVAVVTDGSAVLGLGNLGPAGALPVMEGKAMLFKEFADVDAFPVCLDTQNTDEIVETIKRIAPVFGGVNLEDISAPRCFEIEERLRQELEIPVFHDDQHGTAIVTIAALENALKWVQKSFSQVRIVINGAGAAGIAIARLLPQAGVSPENICLCDSKGIISKQRDNLTAQKQALAVEASGSLADALVGADIFIGVSVPGVLTPEMVRAMSADPIVLAMANPIPEIQPEAIADTVAVVATGRSDYANQINNVLAFPGVFRGALDCRASTITDRMCLQAAKAIAALINPTQLDREYVIPSVFDERVAPAVAFAVQQAAREDGVARA